MEGSKRHGSGSLPTYQKRERRSPKADGRIWGFFHVLPALAGVGNTTTKTPKPTKHRPMEDPGCIQIELMHIYLIIPRGSTQGQSRTPEKTKSGSCFLFSPATGFTTKPRIRDSRMADAWALH